MVQAVVLSIVDYYEYEYVLRHESSFQLPQSINGVINIVYGSIGPNLETAEICCVNDRFISKIVDDTN